jgi:hypothetical protein
VDVGAWLKNLGLGQYETAFRDNGIGEAVLPHLTVEDLKEIGVATVGDRGMRLAAIASLASPTSSDATGPRLSPAPHNLSTTCLPRIGPPHWAISRAAADGAQRRYDLCKSSPTPALQRCHAVKPAPVYLVAGHHRTVCGGPDPGVVAARMRPPSA